MSARTGASSHDGQRRPTLRDVATRAGVSTSMAARILSGERRRRDRNDERVRRAASELDYRPNLVARSLRSRATGMVAMVVPEISNPFFPGLIEAVTRRLGAEGRTLLLADACGDPDLEARHVRALLDQRVDGLLVAPVDAALSAAALDQVGGGLPVVQVDRYVTGAAGHVVTTDNDHGMREVVEHVASVGAHDLVLVSGSDETSTGTERREAFHAAAEVVGLARRPDVLGGFDVATGHRAVDRLIADGTLPDAIVCGADLVALGVLERLRQVGAQRPIVTGFDDIGLASVSYPALTTVRQPTDELAQVAIDLLARPATPGQHVRLRPELVVRGTSVPTAAEVPR